MADLSRFPPVEVVERNRTVLNELTWKLERHYDRAWPFEQREILPVLEDLRARKQAWETLRCAHVNDYDNKLETRRTFLVLLVRLIGEEDYRLGKMPDVPTWRLPP
jgi:hypothetical protein